MLFFVFDNSRFVCVVVHKLWLHSPKITKNETIYSTDNAHVVLASRYLPNSYKIFWEWNLLWFAHEDIEELYQTIISLRKAEVTCFHAHKRRKKYLRSKQTHPLIHVHCTMSTHATQNSWCMYVCVCILFASFTKHKRVYLIYHIHF